MKILYILLPVLFFYISPCVLANGMAMTSREKALLLKNDKDLFAEGMKMVNQQKLDSAFTYLSIIVKRYDENPEKAEDIGTVIKTLRWIGNIFSAYFNDIENAYMYLSRARKLAEESGIEESLPMIYSSLATLWQADNTLYSSSDSQVQQYLKMAFDKAWEQHNDRSIAIIMTNTCLIAWQPGKFILYQDMLNKYLKYKYSSNPPMRAYTQQFAAALIALHNGQLQRGEQYLQLALAEVPGIDMNTYTFRYAINTILTETYSRMRQYDKMLAKLRENLRLAQVTEDESLQLGSLQALGNYFNMVQQPDSVQKYHMAYLKMHEKVSSNPRNQRTEDVKFLNTVEKIDTHITDLLAEKRQRERLMWWIVALLATVMLMLGGTVYRLRYIRRRNRELFNKHQEIMAHEEYMLNQNAILRQQLQALQRRSVTLPPDAGQEDVMSSEKDKAVKTSEKYKASAMDKETSTELYHRVLDVMENSPQIYQPEFSIVVLAEMVGSKRTYISQSINENSGGTFLKMLGSYRIREACRRFTDVEHYGNMTVEGISQSVGYLSRTSFAKLFKQIVGLSPSEYQRQALLKVSETPFEIVSREFAE